MKKVKFYVDYCFEADTELLSKRYWFSTELDEQEYEELKVVHKERCDEFGDLNSWNSDWTGHDSLYDKILANARFSLREILLESKRELADLVLYDTKWTLSDETIDEFGFSAEE